MEITEVKIYKMNEEKLKAYVSVTLNGAFVIKDIKVVHGANGLFVAMPSRKGKDGTYRDIAHPVNKETRELFEKQILAAYEKEISALLERAET